MTDVFLVRTDDCIKGMQSIFTHFKALFESLEGKHVVIKPNFNTADPPPASTDIQIIQELISHLKTCRTKKITVAERAGPVDTQETMKAKGLFKLRKELSEFEIIDLSTLPESEWIHFQTKDSHWKNGFLYPKIYRDADAIIALPCLKTHRYGGHFTMSLKLAVGLVPRQGHNYMQELHSSSHQRSMIAEINQVFTPTLIILDGIDAFVDGGPEKGKLVHPQIMLASNDRVAIDAIGVAILRDHGTTTEVSNGSIFDQEQIARAIELDLGVGQPSEIKIVTSDPASNEYAKKLQKML